jgi:hypothetical protein
VVKRLRQLGHGGCILGRLQAAQLLRPADLDASARQIKRWGARSGFDEVKKVYI